MNKEELKNQYEAGRLSFQQYTEQLSQRGEQLTGVTLSNRIDDQLYRLASQPLGKKTSSSKAKRQLVGGDLTGLESERLVRRKIESILSCQVIKTTNNSGLDAYWKADLLIALPNQPMIPVQVKSTAEARRRFNKDMRDKGNRLGIPSELTKQQELVYVASPIVLVPPVSRLQHQLFEQVVLQLKKESEELILVA